MYYGKRKKVRLVVDLTSYHQHLTEGATGTLIPGAACDIWSQASDRFGVVRFDCCGHRRDIVLTSLTDA
jgi:hypothetical protein